MHVGHGTCTSSVDTQRRSWPMRPRSLPPFVFSWRRNFCSGWKYSASWVPPEMRLVPCELLQTGWRYVNIRWLVSRPDILRTDSGITHTGPRQRLFSFCSRVLRDHRSVLSTYLSLGAHVVPKNIDGTKTIPVVYPTLHATRVRGADAMGFKHRSHIIPLHSWVSCMVSVQ